LYILDLSHSPIFDGQAIVLRMKPFTVGNLSRVSKTKKSVWLLMAVYRRSSIICHDSIAKQDVRLIACLHNPTNIGIFLRQLI
jgi:hypothetical protein